MTGLMVSEDQLVHVALAEASAQLDCAELLFERDMRALREIAEFGVRISHQQAAEVARNGAYACRLLMLAGQRLLDHSGSSVIYDGNPIGNLYRHIAGSQHIVFMWEFSAEQYGRVRLGLPQIKATRRT